MARSPKKAAAEAAAETLSEAVANAGAKIEDVLTPESEGNTSVARARFSKALEEARAGAEALGQEAKERGEAYRETLAAKRGDLVEEARALTGEARERAAALANDGKARASDALSGLGKIVGDNAPVIDEHLGEKYGDYARTAARQIQEAAAKIESKDLGEIGDDAREFVRTSPGLAIGMAAVAGFLLARVFRGGKD